MNIIKNCKECELNPDSCGVVCMSDIQPASEKTAAASSPSVPAVESRPLVSVQIDAAVYSEFVYMCELATENGSCAGYTDPSQLIAYVLSSVADGSRRPGSWERQMLEMMGLVADCDAHYEYRASFGNPASYSEGQSK